MRSNTFSFVNAWLTFCIVIAFWNVNKNDNFNEFLLLAWDLLASASVRVLLLLRIFKLLKSTRYNYLTNLNSSIHMTGTTLPQIRELEWDGRHNYSPGTAYGSEPRCLQWNRKPRYNLLAHINTSVSLISKQGKITFKLKQTGVVVEDNSVGLLSVGQVIFSTLENCWQFECFKRSFFSKQRYGFNWMSRVSVLDVNVINLWVERFDLAFSFDCAWWNRDLQIWYLSTISKCLLNT